jgi:hypothetical protein
MILGNGTHSKGDPAHLTFTKVKVRGRVLRIPSSMHTKDHPTKKREKMMMLATIKEKRRELKKKKRAKKREEKENDI